MFAVSLEGGRLLAVRKTAFSSFQYIFAKF